MAFWQKWKAWPSLERIRDSRWVTPIVIWYDALSLDQKNIARFCAMGGTLCLIFLVLYMGHQSIKTLREELALQQELLSEIMQHETIFQQQFDKLKYLEKEAQQKSADFSLLTTLESLAQQAAIGRESIESINPKQLPPGKYFVETEATVQLVRVTLKQLVHYFYRIEASPHQLQLKEARVKPRFDDPNSLNVTFKVSVFLPKG